MISVFRIQSTIHVRVPQHLRQLIIQQGLVLVQDLIGEDVAQTMNGLHYFTHDGMSINPADQVFHLSLLPVKVVEEMHLAASHLHSPSKNRDYLFDNLCLKVNQHLIKM